MTNAEKFIEVMNKTFNAGLDEHTFFYSLSPCAAYHAHGCSGAVCGIDCKGCKEWWQKEYAEPVQQPGDEPFNWQWISVEDRLPEDKQRVLVYSPFNVGSDVGPIAVQSGWMCKNKNHGITHWMPLPELLEAGDKNA